MKIQCGGCGEVFSTLSAKTKHRVDGRCLFGPHLEPVGLYRIANGYLTDTPAGEFIRPYGAPTSAEYHHIPNTGALERIKRQLGFR